MLASALHPLTTSAVDHPLLQDRDCIASLSRAANRMGPVCCQSGGMQWGRESAAKKEARIQTANSCCKLKVLHRRVSSAGGKDESVC